MSDELVLTPELFRLVNAAMRLEREAGQAYELSYVVDGALFTQFRRAVLEWKNAERLPREMTSLGPEPTGVARLRIDP